MSNKLVPLVVVLFVIVAFVVMSVDKGEKASDGFSQMIPRLGESSPVPSVDVWVSESKKFEANEFVTVAMIEIHGRDKELLFKQLTSRRASIFEQMKALDISDADIEQNSVEMRKEWSYDRGTRSLTGYVVSQFFAIKSSNRATAAAVIASLSAELDVEISRTSASLKNEAELKKQIIHMAGQKALEKAASYAESVGGKVGKVLSVSENGGGHLYGTTVLGARKAMSFDGAEGASLSSVADSVEISATVHLITELLQ